MLKRLVSDKWNLHRADKIVEHITAKINAAELRLKPYPHFIVHDLMPPDFYSIAQDFCAKGTAYAFPIPNGNGEARFPITAAFKNSPQLSEEAQEFWSFFRETVCATVNRVGSAKMQRQIDRYLKWLRRSGFVGEKAEPPVFVDSALQVFQRTVSAVGAHHHSLYELVTNLIYMPADDRMADTGTGIDRMAGYLHVKSGKVFGLSWRRPFLFKADATCLMRYNVVPKFLESGVTRADYMPNTLLSILNTPWSLHSQRTPHSDKRHLLLFASLIDKKQWTDKYRDVRKSGFELYPDELDSPPGPQ